MYKGGLLLTQKMIYNKLFYHVKTLYYYKKSLTVYIVFCGQTQIGVFIYSCFNKMLHFITLWIYIICGTVNNKQCTFNWNFTCAFILAPSRYTCPPLSCIKSQISLKLWKNIMLIKTTYSKLLYTCMYVWV